MADTLNAFAVSATWTNLNTLTGIAVGTALTLQNVGGPNDVIEAAISTTMPATNFTGVRMEQNEFFGVDSGENDVWVRYIRLDRKDLGGRTTKIQVQL